MKQKDIIEHMKNGAQLNVWLEGIVYKGTLTIDNDGIFPNTLASLTDPQINSLLKYDFIVIVGTGVTAEGWIIQYYKYKEE